MEKILRIFEKYIIPEALYKKGQPIYHFLMAFFSALFYGFPSRLRQCFRGQAKKMIIIGVTGTKGKTTTCDLIYQILNFSGYKTGLATTANFAIGDLKWQNKTKQTMPGRFKLQKLLARIAKENCVYAVIETSSEGILQFRHRFLDYSVAVFTNLSPEHIERHGGFENYRNAKIKLFEKTAQKKDAVGIYNLDDENAKYFLKPPIKNRYFYALNPEEKQRVNIQNLNVISNVKSSIKNTKFSFNGEKIEMPLIGEFNVYNAAAAICVALSQNIPMEKIKKALAIAKPPKGRLEIVNQGQNFTVIIDYAHEPASLEAVYSAIAKSKIKNQKSKMICLLGAQGGGRDKWKRPEMGKIASQYCDKIILTNEDPYDEQPKAIINDIASGCSQILNSKSEILKIIDRKKAIKKTLSLAKKGDVVISTGKGGESWMCVENNQKIPWDERKIVEEILTTRSQTTNTSESTNNL